MKKLLVTAAVIAAAVVGYRKWVESESEKNAWKQGTDTVD